MNMSIKKQKLVDKIIAQVKKDFLEGDVTVLEELLSFIPEVNLIQSLPEDKWTKTQKKIVDKYLSDYHDKWNAKQLKKHMKKVLDIPK